MISLKNRLIITYTLFIALALSALTAAINIISGRIFETFVRKSIAAECAEIVRAVSDLYRPMQRNFNLTALEAVGMLYVHNGYIIDVEDSFGNPVWDARDMDMEHCVEALDKISGRMEHDYGLKIELVNVSYPVTHNGIAAGTVNIASVGPFFYTEAQSAFLDSLNRLLAAAALIFLLVCVVMSIGLAEGISRPIRTAGRAARAIASFYANGSTHGTLNVRIPENHTTTELTGLSQSINELGRELAEGERRQKQLMNDIAHELRTPLTCLCGALEAVADGVWEASPERLENCLDEVRRLSKMLDDIMLLTRLEWENITLHKTHFDVSALLKNAAERFMCAAAEKGIVLTAHTVPAVVYADYDRIMQVIVNLLSNAVRYTDTGRITLTIEPSELNAEEGGEPPSLQPYGLSLPPMRGAADATKRACRPPSIQRGDTSLPEAPRNAPANSSPIAIKVADTGCGIDAADLPRIFERFYRADKSRNRNSGGLGVGLSIAAAIAAAHGWELSAESKSGEGSVFTIIAPQGGEQFYSR